MEQYRTVSRIQLPAPSDSISSLAWFPKTEKFAVGAWDGSLTVWEIRKQVNGEMAQFRHNGLARTKVPAPVFYRQNSLARTQKKQLGLLPNALL